MNESGGLILSKNSIDANFRQIKTNSETNKKLDKHKANLHLCGYSLHKIKKIFHDIIQHPFDISVVLYGAVE